MSRVITLYRGDSIPECAESDDRSRARSFADHFCSDGLRAKFADGCSSELLHGRDLLDVIVAHVGYECKTEEQKLAHRSPLMSFSENLDVALRFCNPGNKRLVRCKFRDAKHFVWALEIDLKDEIQPGRHAFPYKSDPVNCQQILTEEFWDGWSRFPKSNCMSDVALPLGNCFGGVHAHLDDTIHYAELFHVEKFIRSSDVSNIDDKLLSNALARTGRDQEWLLYPLDPMPDGYGVSTRFAMNRHLRIHSLYRRA